MSIKVYLSERIRDRTRLAEVNANGTTLGDVINDLNLRFPGFRNDVYSESKAAFRDHIAVAINGSAIGRAELATVIADGDQITIVASAKGG